jgi:hypothetical protein
MHNTSSKGEADFITVQQLPKNAIEVKTYGNYTLKGLHFHHNLFYLRNDANQIRVLRIGLTNDQYAVWLSFENKQRPIYYKKFKREYNLTHIPEPEIEYDRQQRYFRKELLSFHIEDDPEPFTWDIKPLIV